MSRRKFLAGAGAVTSAMALGAESVDAQQLSEKDIERANAMREEITGVLQLAIPFLRQLELGTLERYCSYVEKVLRDEVLEPAYDEHRRTHSDIYNLYNDDAESRNPRFAVQYARKIIDHLNGLIGMSKPHIAAKGLQKDLDRLRERITAARNKLIELEK